MPAKESAGMTRAIQQLPMNVGLYSGAAGMRVGEEYQNLISENLSLQSVPGYKQTFPVFSTDPQAVTEKSALATHSGNPAAITMSRMIDFSQGAVQSTGNPYNVAIEGKGFFQVREADGSTSYTRNGCFSLSPTGQVLTADGATVLGKSGSPIMIDTTAAGNVVIGNDGAISQNGETHASLGFAHFDSPSASLQPAAFGRFVAKNSSDAKTGLAPNDSVVQGSLEQSNGNPVTQMADMIQAARMYEASSKSMKAVDDTQNQLITNLGARPQG
jgi:flagellar basal body rod protein FlgG